MLIPRQWGLGLKLGFRGGPNLGGVHAATRWRDSVCGTHVEYDQRPDVFRCAAWLSLRVPWTPTLWLLPECMPGGKLISMLHGCKTVMHCSFSL